MRQRRKAHSMDGLAEIRGAFDRFGGIVQRVAQVMSDRAGAPSADDITVAAFVALGRAGPLPDEGAVLARLLRDAGLAARPTVGASPPERALVGLPPIGD